ncbi:MAG TPA: hypothetical protein VI386_16265 [Candidatus Sulfotelmatobacter sp.]
MTMTDDAFINRFEQGLVPAESFHHTDHVYLAFAYLMKYPVLEALERFVNALKRFAAAHAKARLYHETITFACFFLIREAIARSGVNDWEQFCIFHPELLLWKNSILTRYYNEATLKSDLARKVFIFPEKIDVTAPEGVPFRLDKSLEASG